MTRKMLIFSDESNTRHGFTRVRLLKNEDVPTLDDERDSLTSLEVTHELDLPDDDTTYWCSTHKLPRQFRMRKHHGVMVSR